MLSGGFVAFLIGHIIHMEDAEYHSERLSLQISYSVNPVHSARFV